MQIMASPERYDDGVSIALPQELLLGAAESPRHAGEDERDSGADQRSVLVVTIVITDQESWGPLFRKIDPSAIFLL